MKLVEKEKEGRKFVLAEENGVFTFRISDSLNSNVFNLTVDELRALRDVISHYINEYDKNLIKTLNQSSTGWDSNLVGLSALDLSTSQTQTQEKPKEKEERLTFEFF